MTPERSERRKALIDVLLLLKKDIIDLDDQIKVEPIINLKHLMLARRAGIQHAVDVVKDQLDG